MTRNNSPSRISDTLSGKSSLACLLMAFALLLTSATDGHWYSLFLPSIPIVLALVLFITGVVRGDKLPQLSLLSWLSLTGAGYFLIRAWFSDSYYDKLSDVSLVFTGMIFYVLGILMGVSKKEDHLLFRAIAFFIVAGAIILIAQLLTNNAFTVLRPSSTITLEQVGNVSYFGYKNFAGHFFVAGGIFCCAYFITRGLSSWKWLLTGIISLLMSLWCHSRAVYPNLCIGFLICWLIFLCKIYHRTKLFIICCVAGLFIIMFSVAAGSIFLSQNQPFVQSIADLWISGERFQLFAIGIDQAFLAPFFGHGAMSFENLALPHFIMIASPNMAHNEYVQSMCDYGFVGFAILLTILIAHLVRGFRQILANRSSHQPATARIAASLALLVIAAMHASMDFIWHNGAIVAMGAFCAGIVCAGDGKNQRAGKPLNNYALTLISLLAIAFYSFIACKAYPVWKNDWAINNIAQNNLSEKLSIVKETVSEEPDPIILNPYASVLSSIETQRGIVAPEELAFLEDALRQSLKKSPGNKMAQTYLGIILSLQGKHDEADLILEPFTREYMYCESIFPWRAHYISHLSSWADATMRNEPSKSLSIAREAKRRNDSLNHRFMSYRRKMKISSKLEMQAILIEEDGISPDDAWMKNHQRVIEKH